jgi:hypothetical protein
VKTIAVNRDSGFFYKKKNQENAACANSTNPDGVANVTAKFLKFQSGGVSSQASGQPHFCFKPGAPAIFLPEKPQATFSPFRLPVQ